MVLLCLNIGFLDLKKVITAEPWVDTNTYTQRVRKMMNANRKRDTVLQAHIKKIGILNEFMSNEKANLENLQKRLAELSPNAQSKETFQRKFKHS